MSASIIESLVISGSHKSDGSANASGKVWAYLPNTSTTAQLYSDVDGTLVLTQPLVLDAGGLVPRATSPDGVFTSIPIRLYIEDADGVVVSDSLFTPATASTVSVDNSAMSGTTLDAVLTAAQTSTGGKDFKYLESGGATERPIQDKFREQGIWVTDFGATGDPNQIATTFIQQAVNRALATGVANVFLPAGTFKTDGAIVCQNGTVRIRGLGRGVTIVTPTHATANAFTFSACPSSRIDDLSILHTTGSTGGAVVVGGASPNFNASNLYVPANATYAGFAYGFDFSGASDFDLIANTQMIGATRTARFDCTSTTKPGVLQGNLWGAASLAPVPSTIAVEFNGANGNYHLIGNTIIGNTSAILFNAAFTGTSVSYHGNTIFSTGATMIDVTGLAADRNLLRLENNNGIDGYTVNVLSGATATPDRSKGRHIRIVGTTTGVAYVVAAPTPAPSLGATRDTDLFLTFYNNAGGAVTGWTLNAAYHMDAVSTVNLEMTSYHLKWDADIQVWRQFSRSVST